MHLKILTWNIWGLNDVRKRQLIRAVLRRWKPRGLSSRNENEESKQ